ncbi:Type I restriction-modification enzyme subunit S, partial [Candidatus Arthromitus sp. SFB-1]
RIGWQGLTKEEYLIDGKYQLITGVNFVNGSVDFSKCYFVSEERYLQDKNIQIKEKDILVTKDGTLGKIAYINKLIKPSTLNSGIFVVRCNDESVVLSKYLFYYLRSPKLMNFARSRLTGGTIKHLNQNVIIEFPVCVPSLPEQERIVSILDKFDKLCNDISEGLPAEIDARKKQYEYYRDKLLTFKNISEHKD